MTFVAPAGDPRRTTAQAGRSPTAVYSPLLPADRSLLILRCLPSALPFITAFYRGV